MALGNDFTCTNLFEVPISKVYKQTSDSIYNYSIEIIIQDTGLLSMSGYIVHYANQIRVGGPQIF